MGNPDLSRFALSACVAAAMLTGCGVPRQAQDDMQPPVGAPGAMPQAAQAASYSYQVLYFFGGDRAGNGAAPQGRLIDVNGTLYGTANYGGAFRNGTVYSVGTNGGEKVLYSFDSFGSGSDGSRPQGDLLSVKGTLYGTTLSGGGSACKCGTVFSISTGGAEKVLYSFAGGSDGVNPGTSLIDVRGTLYGTSYAGGGSKCDKGYGCGTVFRISKAGSEKVLYRFAGNLDGQGPQSGLLNVGGNLYGTTDFGGGTGCTARVESRHGDGCGTVYRVSLTGSEKVLYRFAGSSAGAVPLAGLISVSGTLYGTTYAGGGSDRCGRPGVAEPFTALARLGRNKCSTVSLDTPTGRDPLQA